MVDTVDDDSWWQCKYGSAKEWNAEITRRKRRAEENQRKYDVWLAERRAERKKWKEFVGDRSKLELNEYLYELHREGMSMKAIAEMASVTPSVISARINWYKKFIRSGYAG